MDSSDRAPILGLKKYFEIEIPGLNEVSEGWPDPKEQLVMPTMSLMHSKNPILTNLHPYIYEQNGVKNSIPDPDEPLNNIYDFVVGQYESTIQVDLWTEYKPERGEFYDKIVNALDKDFIDKHLANGLSLKLTNYHNVIARFDQVGYTYIDSEDAAQRAEWRVKLDLLVQWPKIIQKSMPRISETTLTTQIGQTNNVEDDDQSIEESTTII